MKKMWIIALCLIGAGLLLCMGVLIAIRFDFSGLSTDKITTEEYTITDPFSYMEITTDEADVRILPSEDSTCRIVCRQWEKRPHKVTVEADMLRVQVEDQRDWYDYISLFSFGKTEVTIYLPVKTYASLFVSGNTGDVFIHSSVSSLAAGVYVSTGDVTVEANITTTLSVETSTGDVNVKGVSLHDMTLIASTGNVTLTSATVEDELKLTTTTGRIKIVDTHGSSIHCETSTGGVALKNTEATWSLKAKASTGNVTLEGCDGRCLDIETTTGDVRLDACDGLMYLIRTTTGNVKGTMLSDMVFTARSDTGRVQVPTSTRGGSCLITTDTGDIRIEILPAA